MPAFLQQLKAYLAETSLRKKKYSILGVVNVTLNSRVISNILRQPFKYSLSKYVTAWNAFWKGLGVKSLFWLIVFLFCSLLFLVNVIYDIRMLTFFRKEYLHEQITNKWATTPVKDQRVQTKFRSRFRNFYVLYSWNKTSWDIVGFCLGYI